MKYILIIAFVLFNTLCFSQSEGVIGYDTMKVRLLIDEGGTIPIQRNGWQVIELFNRNVGFRVSINGKMPPDILLFADKKTSVDNNKVWQFKRFNW